MAKIKDLPQELKEYIGSGKSLRLLDGYIRLLSTDEQIKQYSDVMQKWNSKKTDIPFAVTAFGDILAWTGDGYISMNRLIDNRSDIILSGAKFFFSVVTDKSFQREWFDIELHVEARKKIGEIKDDECYTFEPVPALGGSKELSNLKKGKTLEYLYIVASLS